MLESKKDGREYAAHDSNIENDLAGLLDKNESVKVYAKLPG